MRKIAICIRTIAGNNILIDDPHWPYTVSLFDKTTRPYIEKNKNKKNNDESSIDTRGHLLMLYKRIKDFVKKKKKINISPLHDNNLTTVTIVIQQYFN